MSSDNMKILHHKPSYLYLKSTKLQYIHSIFSHIFPISFKNNTTIPSTQPIGPDHAPNLALIAAHPAVIMAATFHTPNPISVAPTGLIPTATKVALQKVRRSEFEI